jgi:hypothetical protein
MQAKLEKLNKPLPKVYAAYYGEDWKTQGDWYGRYGRQYAVMCAASAPFDQFFFIDESFFTVRPFIGANKRNGDSLRRWVHWIKTNDKRVLYSPLNGYRRQAEWDDHAETYPMTHNGPDVWYLLDIKNDGVYKISMYFFNKDGHSGNNRMRDYMIELYTSPRSWTQFNDWEKFAKLAELQPQKPPLERSRMRDFWGGVHKSFVVKGNSRYFVRVSKNYSFNTIISSVCIDRLHGETTLNDKMRLPLMSNVPYEPPPFPEFVSQPFAFQSKKLWDMIDTRYDKLGLVNCERSYRLRAYQGVAGDTSKQSKQLSDAMEWRLNIWDTRQRNDWQQAMQLAWERLSKTSPEHIKHQEEFLRTKKNPWKYWGR